MVTKVGNHFSYLNKKFNEYKLGLLLSRGCLISVLMIIFVLPQCLLLCDKLIEKTSRKTKFYKKEDYVKVKAKTLESR